MPDPIGYLLSPRDAALVKQLAENARRLKPSRPDLGKIEHEEQPSPEMHLFRVPTGGIPGREPGTETGTAADEILDDYIYSKECEVWRIVHGEEDIEERRIQPVTGLYYRLHNPFDIDVPGEEFVLGWRDKYGDWWVDRASIPESAADQYGTGTGTDNPFSDANTPCGLLTINWTDCVKVTSNDGTSAILSPTGGGYWTSDSDLTYFNGTSSGPVQFWVSGGKVHVSVDGLELIDCGNGRFSGGPLTGHYPETASGTGTQTRTPCAGETFYVTVSCTCCSIPGWDGPGWYCVRDADTYGTGTPYNCVVVYLEEEDRCDETIEICSGPYDTEEEANVGCYGEAGTGTGTVVLIEVCGGTYPEEFCFTVTAVGGDTPAAWIGHVFRLTHVGGGIWVTNGADTVEGGLCAVTMTMTCGDYGGGNNFFAEADGDLGESDIGVAFNIPSGGPYTATVSIVDPLINPPPCASFDEFSMTFDVEGC